MDDLLYVTVNGIRSKVVPIGETASADLSHAFVNGQNSVRIQTMNTGGPASYAMQLLVDGQVVVNASCANAPCTPATTGGTGILFDQTYQVTTPNRPVASTFTVSGTAGGAIYTNDAYTGRTAPASFMLAPGGYTVGLGVGTGAPGAYAGQYYEQVVTLGSSPLTAVPSQYAPLNTPNHNRIAILPIRQAINGSGGPTNTGILSNDDIAVMVGQTLVTRDTYVKPFSYGLTTWDVELLPTVEDVPLYRDADSGAPPDIGRFLTDANLTALKQMYDTIIYFFSKYTASGDEVANGPCCFWGIGQEVDFPNHLTRRADWPVTRPNFYLLHEVLHDYESYNEWRLHFYNGAGGVHGAGQHGYHGGDGGEEDFILFYRLLMRNQIAEVNTMRGELDWTSSIPSNADFWPGVFDTMRRELGNAKRHSEQPECRCRQNRAHTVHSIATSMRIACALQSLVGADNSSIPVSCPKPEVLGMGATAISPVQSGWAAIACGASRS